MMRLDGRKRAYALGGVVLLVLVAVGLYVLGRTPAEEEPRYPTFSATPSAEAYGSIEKMASELEKDGLPCGELESQEMDQASQEGIDKFATCFLLGDRSQNVELWLFDSAKSRIGWVNAFKQSTLVIFGPNWAATPQDDERAEAVLGSLGGTLVGKVQGP